TESSLTAREYGLLAGVPGDELVLLDMVGEDGPEMRLIEWGGEEDARRGIAGVQRRHGQIVLPGQRVGFRQAGAAAGGPAELPARAGTALRNAIGIGERHQLARALGRRLAPVLDVELAPPMCRNLRHRLRATRFTAQQLDAMAQIGVARPRIAAQN